MSQNKPNQEPIQSIQHCIESAMEQYFADMDGHDPDNLYELVLSQVEKPMLKIVLQQTQHHITRSAKILGINRATLRKKLTKYGLE